MSESRRSSINSPHSIVGMDQNPEISENISIHEESDQNELPLMKKLFL